VLNENKKSVTYEASKDSYIERNELEIICLKQLDALKLVSLKAGSIRLFPLLADGDDASGTDRQNCFVANPSHLRNLNDLEIEFENLGNPLSVLKIDESFTNFIGTSPTADSEKFYLSVQYIPERSNKGRAFSVISQVVESLRHDDALDKITYLSAIEHERLEQESAKSSRESIENHNTASKFGYLAEIIHRSSRMQRNGLRPLCIDHFSNKERWEHSAKASQFDLFKVSWDAQNNQMCLALFALAAAEHGSVVSIGVRQNIRLMNDVVRGTVQSGAAHMEPFTALGLSGEGEIIGIADTGLDENSCFFVEDDRKPVARSCIDSPTFDLSKRKVIQYVNYSDSGDYTGGHGSHVAGTLGGSCIDESSDRSSYNGVAPKAKISMFDIAWPSSNPLHEILHAPADVTDMLKPSYAAGAKIFSGSWGGGYWYDSYCAGIDEYLSEHPDFLVIVAAGNMGAFGLSTILSPSIAKNTIAVGASVTPRSLPRDVSNLAHFSSVGPTFDGRIKPDIVAPGQYVYSVNAAQESAPRETCAVSSKQGTSMATPAVAGAAALIRQYFRDSKFWASFCNPEYDLCKQGSFNPSGYLTKAIILHSGSPMMTFPSSLVANSYESRNLISFDKEIRTPPDYQQGFGRINLSSVLPISGYDPLDPAKFDLFIDDAELASSYRVNYEVNVWSSSIPLKVTISWYDPPNIGFSPRLLVHDLDLILIDPEGNRRSGNCRPDIELSDCKRDSLNNNEQIFIPSPMEGIWRVMVEAKLLTYLNKQKYALVVTGNCSVSLALAEEYEYLSDLCHNQLVDSGGPASASLSFGMFNFGKSSTVTDEYIDSLSISDLVSGEELGRQYFDKAYFFDRKSICLQKGCYRMAYERIQNGTTVPLGSITDPYADTLTMSSLPACNTFVSPAVVEESFCLVSKDASSSDQNNLKCVQSCKLRDNLRLSIALLDDYWRGDYYTLRDLKTSAVISGGTLEMGYGKYAELCLPARPACYELYLRTSGNASPSPGNTAISDEGANEPRIVFHEAEAFNSFLSAATGGDYSSCSNSLSVGNQSAHLCTDGRFSVYIKFNDGNESVPFDASLFSETNALCAQSISFESRGKSMKNVTYLRNREDVAEVIYDVASFVLKQSSTIDLIITPEVLSDLLIESHAFSCSYLRDTFSSADVFINWTHFLGLVPKYSMLKPTVQCSLAVYYLFACGSIDHDIISPDVVNVNPGILIDLEACVDEIKLLEFPEDGGSAGTNEEPMPRSVRLLIALAIMSAGAIVGLVSHWRPCRWGRYLKAPQLDASQSQTSESRSSVSETSLVSSAIGSPLTKTHEPHTTGPRVAGSGEADDDDDLEALGISLGQSEGGEEELGSDYFEDRLRHLSSLIENPRSKRDDGPPPPQSLSSF
jgi:hypothetical protein